MTAEAKFGKMLGVGDARHAVDERLDADSSEFVFKVEATSNFWPEK